MKILVTGSAGFIGSALTLALLRRGDSVIGIDNHNDYYDPKLKKARLARHIDHPHYTDLRIDIADRSALEEAFVTYKPQRVVNLAAQAGRALFYRKSICLYQKQHYRVYEYP